MYPGEKACRPVTIEQTPDGYASLHGNSMRLRKAPEVLVVMEATGAYWITLAATGAYRLSGECD